MRNREKIGNESVGVGGDENNNGETSEESDESIDGDTNEEA